MRHIKTENIHASKKLFQKLIYVIDNEAFFECPTFENYCRASRADFLIADKLWYVKVIQKEVNSGFTYSSKKSINQKLTHPVV